MIFIKEKTRLETLKTSVLEIEKYTDANLEILNESYRTYAEIMKILYVKEPNIFGNLYKYELKEIKGSKKSTKESTSDEAMEQNLLVYKDTVIHAIERTVDYIADYIES